MFTVSRRVADFCRNSPERMAWLERLPHTIALLAERWQLSMGERFDGEGDASWVAPAVRRDGTPAVLKLGMPHWEADQEADGLRFWNGDPTVQLLEADDAHGAMLLERCEPGTPPGDRPDLEQDEVLAGLLHRMWKVPPAGHRFRPLAAMVERWIAETLEHEAEWDDAGLVRAGIAAFRDLAAAGGTVLIATDLHAGNVLRARREPWLAIDPKPFVGDPAYDATQHLLCGVERVSDDPPGTIGRFAGLLELDADRVRRWLFARLAAGPRENWARSRWASLTRVLGRSE